MDVIASGALARGFGALGGRVSFGGQRRDALIEASGASLEVLAAFAGLLGDSRAPRNRRFENPSARQRLSAMANAPRMNRICAARSNQSPCAATQSPAA